MPSSKRSKILVIMLGLIMLSSGFAYGISSYGNATGPSNIIHAKDISKMNLGNFPGSSIYTSSSKSKGDISDPQPNTMESVYGYLSLGNVSTSYLDNVYVPTVLQNGSPFKNMTEIFSFDPSILSFSGVLNDVSSENVTFSDHMLNAGIIQIEANGSFGVPFNPTTLFYLNFTTLAKEQVQTQVTSDFLQLGNIHTNLTRASSIKLATGWTNIGPENIQWANTANDSSGVASAVGIDPRNLNIIYLASGQSHPVTGPGGYPGVSGFGGMEKSVDGGKSWRTINLGLESTLITAISVSPYDSNTVVVETRNSTGYPIGGAIYKSINGGQSWQETYGMGGYGLQYSGNTLYATTFQSVLSSTNFGSSWTAVSNFSAIVTASDILGNGRIMYVGLWFVSPDYVVGVHSAYVEILRSANYGQNFTVLANFSEAQFKNLTPSISQIAVNPSNHSQIWVLISTPYFLREHGNPSLFDSMDNGTTWTETNTSSDGMGFLQEPPQYMAFDSSNGSLFYIAGPGFLFKSTDGGGHFIGLHFGYDNRFIYVDTLNDSIVFAGSDQGFYESKDGGSTWVPLNNRSASILYDVGVVGNRVFATVQDFAPLFSNDSGKRWTTVVTGETGFVGVDPYNNSNVIIWTESHTTVGGPFFFVSNDGGESFYLPSINFTAEVNPLVGTQSIAFSNGTPPSIYVTGGVGIFRSNDSGKSWILLQGSPQYSLSIASSPSNPDVLYVSNYTGLFETVNGGKSWFNTYGNVIGSLLSPFPAFNSLAVDPTNGSIIVGVQFLPSLQKDTFGNELTGYLFISYNGGKTFTYGGINEETFVLAPPYAYFATYQGKQILIFTTGKGIFLSQNLGKDWSDVSYNLPSKEISSFFTSTNGTSYISTYGSGIWVDRNLLNYTFNSNPPVLTGFIPKNISLAVNGKMLTENGYFTTRISSGKDILTIFSSSFVKNVSFEAINGSVYYYNFSNFIEKYYPIRFTESGLPPQTSWSVTLNGTTKSSSSSNITFLVPNGTYSYSIASIQGYSVATVPGYNETSGSLTVNGYNLSYPVTFLHNNEGYFVATVYPVNATLYINGTAYQRTGILVSTPAGNSGGGAVEFFNISLAPGTYQVKIAATGYHTYTTTITMSSQLTPIYRNYTLEEISSHSSFPLLYAAFAAVIVVIAAITTVILLRRRGRKR